MNKSNTTEKVITSVFTLIIGVLLLSTFINSYVMVVIIGIVVTLIAAAIFED